MLPFNGAVTKMLRKLSQTPSSITIGTNLQWGRNKNATEIRGYDAMTIAVTALQWGRNKNATEMGSVCAALTPHMATFNGAVTKMLRKLFFLC